MVRPRVKHKFQRNGESFKYYKDGSYVGSISFSKLGQMIAEQRNKDPMGELTQKEPRENCATKVGYDPNQENDTDGYA